MGLVIRTNFLTTKGNLIRDILYPKPNKFRFYQDTLKFLLCMSILAVVGILFTLPFLADEDGYGADDVIIRSLRLFTITVPPALPAAMNVGTIFSI